MRPPFATSSISPAIRTCTLILALFPSSVAMAHKPSDSYLKIQGGEEHLTAQWDIALKDLEFVIGLDSNQNSEITWGEVKSQRQSIVAHALSHLKISHHGNPCDLSVNDLLITKHSDGAYAVLVLNTNCPGDASELHIEYSLLFDVDPTHRGLVLYENESIASTHVLSPTAPTLMLQTGEMTLWKAFVDYVREGVWHIWIGLDHILFLLTLLLPAVLLKDIGANGKTDWQAVTSFGPALRSVLKVVTMFTVAHSITLWLATMRYVAPPSHLVEAAIAFSIIVTAMANLYPRISLSGWMVAFGFGLVHGFGFANVLLDLGLSNVTLAVSLLGFNVGVELGQLAIVFAFLPIAFLLRETSFYRWGVLRIGSIVVMGIAAIWMYERLFNAEILGF